MPHRLKVWWSSLSDFRFSHSCNGSALIGFQITGIGSSFIEWVGANCVKFVESTLAILTCLWRNSLGSSSCFVPGAASVFLGGLWLCFVCMQEWVYRWGSNWHGEWLLPAGLGPFQSRNLESVPRLNRQNWCWFWGFLFAMSVSQNYHPKPMSSVHSSYHLKNQRQVPEEHVLSVKMLDWFAQASICQPANSGIIFAMSEFGKRPSERPSKAIVFFKLSEKTTMFARKKVYWNHPSVAHLHFAFLRFSDPRRLSLLGSLDSLDH